MKKLALCAVVLAQGLSLQSAWPEDEASYDGLWKDATEKAGCVANGFADFILVSCQNELTLWYFTKPNHPAYPGVIKRMIAQENGVFNAHEDGWSFGSEAEQPAFKAWFAQVQDLDRQMKESIEKKRQAAGVN